MNLGREVELATLLGLADALHSSIRVTGVNAVSARTAPAITQCQLPFLVTELEAHVQVG
jgi:hypothetical protein